MFDLKHLLTRGRAGGGSDYEVHASSATLMVRRKRDTMRAGAILQLVGSAFLSRERYALNWRIAFEDARRVDRCELLVYVGQAAAPWIVYDLRRYPLYSVSFRMDRAAYVHFELRFRGAAAMVLHTLNVMQAREKALGADPLVCEWNLPLVAQAIEVQHRLVDRLRHLYSMFEWRDICRDWRILRGHWATAFGVGSSFGRLPAPTRGEADPGPGPAAEVLLLSEGTGEGVGEESVGVEEEADAQLDGLNEQARRLRCRLQFPTVIGTSRESIIGTFERVRVQPLHQEGSESVEGGVTVSDVVLRLSGQVIRPTYIHPQYYIWCFPDKECKLALRREWEEPVSGERRCGAVSLPRYPVRFELVGTRPVPPRATYWIGYQLFENLPAFNLWSLHPSSSEPLNRDDLLAIFSAIHRALPF